VPFPGQTFWFEPFPQHFFNGEYIGSAAAQEDRCYPLTPQANETQHWRVRIYNSIVIETARIHRVRVYERLAPLWDHHVAGKGIFNVSVKAADCTHYTTIGSAYAMDALAAVMAQFRTSEGASSPLPTNTNS